ncbi:MAG: F0F1 ATP synthase subunit A [Planctomycetes bacterium]|nr:F0F1 ATP synthase subunit A [Planctomycetota bacterium]
MADPVLHIKDAYFFEVPRVLWKHHYESLDDVPKFLTKAHPHESVKAFNHALNGKILIPQPFGTRKNLFEKESGFCISKFMVLEFLVAVILIAVFTRFSKHIAEDGVPKGKWFNLLETLLLFVRDQIVRPAIGHGADRYVPLMWTFFFFILGCNLFGLIPWAGAATGAFGTTIALACIVLCTTVGSGLKTFGPKWLWTGFVPTMDLPWIMWPLKLMIFVIEVLGLFIKHAVLGVRLLANMVAGHLVLLGILSMALGFLSMATIISVVGATLFSGLELFFAVLQAYIFTFLAALFIGSAVHHH